MSSENPEPFAPSAPAGIPDATVVRRSQQLSRAKLVVAVAAEVLYAIVCAGGIFVVNSRASLANRVAQGDTTITLDQAHAADNSVAAMAGALIVAALLLLVALILWQRNFNKALGKDRARALSRRYGLRYIGLVWALVWVIGSATTNSTARDPQALVSADHRTMLLLGLRAVLLLVIAGLTVLVAKRAEQELQSAPAARQPFAPFGF